MFDVMFDVMFVGCGHMPQVFMFSHKAPTDTGTFIRITAQSTTTYRHVSSISFSSFLCPISISLSPGHYLYVDGSLLTAESVRVGHTLIDANGNPVCCCGDWRVYRGCNVNI